MTATNIVFAPLFPWLVMAILAAASLLALLPGALTRAPGTGYRLLAATAILLALANPSIVEEKREPLKDVAAVVVDDTPSQSVGDRQAQMAQALDDIREQLSRYEDTLDVRELRLAHDSVAATAEGTRVVEPLTRLFS
ncbi:MAG TPA: hypothetical protein ENO14_03860, partial [Chromatiales bacterium]|nr:hypothetical protein [Chromatiales bacterium]